MARTAPPPETGAAETAEELALRAQSGSRDAFVQLVDRFQARLYNFLLRRVAQSADADDLTQETFVRAWQQIHRYRPTWRFSTWLFTIGVRLAASQYRSRRRAGPSMDGGVLDGFSAPEERAPDTEDGLRLWETAALVLSPGQFDALWLRYAEGMAIGDIATVLGRTAVGVRVLLFRARGVLAERARGDGVSPASRRDPRAAQSVAGGAR